MIVDCFTKKRHHIPYTTNENGITTETTTQFLPENV